MCGFEEERLCQVVSIFKDGRMKLPKRALEFLELKGRKGRLAIYFSERDGKRELILRLLEVGD